MQVLAALRNGNVLPPLRKILGFLDEKDLRSLCLAHPQGKGMAEELVLPTWEEDRIIRWKGDYWKGAAIKIPVPEMEEFRLATTPGGLIIIARSSRRILGGGKTTTTVTVTAYDGREAAATTSPIASFVLSLERAVEMDQLLATQGVITLAATTTAAEATSSSVLFLLLRPSDLSLIRKRWHLGVEHCRMVKSTWSVVTALTKQRHLRVEEVLSDGSKIRSTAIDGAEEVYKKGSVLALVSSAGGYALFTRAAGFAPSHRKYDFRLYDLKSSSLVWLSPESCPMTESSAALVADGKEECCFLVWTEQQSKQLVMRQHCLRRDGENRPSVEDRESVIPAKLANGIHRAEVMSEPFSSGILCLWALFRDGAEGAFFAEACNEDLIWTFVSAPGKEDYRFPGRNSYHSSYWTCLGSASEGTALVDVKE